MSDAPTFDAEAYVDHMAAVMAIPIEPAWKPTVVANMATTATIAALVMEFPLDDEIEPATVFEA